jgi:hypothetical protein
MSAVLLGIGIASLITIAVGLWRYFALRGERLVLCPETLQPVAVSLDAAHAAKLPDADLRLGNCSRWPEKKDCDQACLAQIEAEPKATLVWNIIASWYRDQLCIYCKRPFGEIAWHDSMPALRSRQGDLRSWNDIPGEDVPHILATHEPVCWSCEIGESFRRERPDLVIDREDTPLRDRAFH